MNNIYSHHGEGKDKRTDKRKLGDRGEDIAVGFLMKQGYSIRDRNYLRKYGEIDIVAVKGDIYHFIEVKTVSRENIGSVIYETHGYRPEDNVHPWKLMRLSRVIQAYILDKKLFTVDWKFHLITIYLERMTNKVAIDFIEDIVL